jgi:oligopeptidase A
MRMADDPDNPLLSRAVPAPLDQVGPEHVVPAMEAAVAEGEGSLGDLVARSDPRGRYADTVQALDDLIERLDRVYGYAYHLTTVRSTPELRVAFRTAQARYKGFSARLGTHQGLWRALQAYAATADAASLDPLRERHLEKTLRSMRRAGADLPEADRAEVEELRIALAQAQTAFSEHVLDATNAVTLAVTDEAELAGIPAAAVEAAREAAERMGVEGWHFTLHAPAYIAVMNHADSRALRQSMFLATSSRAYGGEHDNRDLVREILRLRRRLAQLLGYSTYAHYVLEERMLSDVERTSEFLETLEARTRPFFDREVAELRSFARERLGLDSLEPWDVRYAFEHLRHERFSVDDEAFRPYFALPAVERGMFELARRLFGVSVARVAAPGCWHPEVGSFEIRDEEGVLLGIFYTDWFPREDKRGGAWANRLVPGGPRDDGGFDPHVGVMCGNLTRGSGGAPALLSLEEVQTLFHEFGHLLHTLLTRVEVRARGAFATSWDFVELPSQLLENWTYEHDALTLFARHVDTGEPIPAELVEKLRASRHFQQAWMQMRQLAYAATDMALHLDYDPEGEDDPVILAQGASERFEIEPRFARTGFVCSFTHVLAGGYAAGYYSYKWAEVLDADAFARFETAGLFDRATGRAFVDTILSRGDADDAIELFRAFMGRDPDLEPMLRRNLGEFPPATT